MAQTYKLTIAYLGTHFYGWQRSESHPTVESALENGIKILIKEPPFLQAASRTDRGVHAKGQVVTFSTTKPIDIPVFLKRINGILPFEITVLSIELISSHFHPTLDSVGKEYTYCIENRKIQTPFNRDTAWHFPYPISVENMEFYANQLIGTHDFKPFENRSEKMRENTICTLHSIRIQKKDEMITITIHGNRFLYKMVRNIVGKLAYLGSGKIHTLSDSAMTAPAHGLTLSHVFY